MSILLITIIAIIGFFIIITLDLKKTLGKVKIDEDISEIFALLSLLLLPFFAPFIIWKQHLIDKKKKQESKS